MSNQKTQKKGSVSSKKEQKFIEYSNLDKVGEIALYYGFTPHQAPSVSKNDLDAAKDILEGDYACHSSDTEKETFPLHVEEKIAFIRDYHEKQMHGLAQPVMLYFKDPCRSPLKKTSKERYADLEILGTSGSIAEATLIQTARAMLVEEGFSDTVVEINSIGDKDSISRFTRELTNYYRKNINEMSPICRQLLKQDPFDLLTTKEASATELNAKAPRSIDFLSEPSRKHLEEILEYLESLGIPYMINNSLIGNRKYCTETIFAITGKTTGKVTDKHTLALGVRYNGLAKRLNMKKDIQGVGISLLIKNSTKSLRKPTKKFKKPIASFIQLGQESKLLSLKVIEDLRKVKVPLYLSLAKDRLGAQVSTIEKHHTPYVIVMGKKEAVEGNVIVRKTDTHAQDIIPLGNLPAHMKKIETEYWK